MANGPDLDWINLAIQAANQSSCSKSRRGVVIASPEGVLVALASNSPPHPFQCTGSDRCKQNCRNVAIHAEERALLRAGARANGGELIHIKTVDGKPVMSGPPSCLQCSRLIVEARIAKVWLFSHGEAWRSWTAERFHEDTMANHGIEV